MKKEKKYINYSFFMGFTSCLIILMLFMICFTKYSIENKDINHIKFEKLLQTIELNYKGETTRDELYKSAINGVINNLDKYSHIVFIKNNKDNNIIDYSNLDGENNEYVGTGISLSEIENGLLVVDIYDDSDLYNKATIGDIITGINGVSYDIKKSKEFIELLKGEKNDIKKIEISSNNTKKTYNIKIKKINKNNITTKVIEDDILYLKIKNFSLNTKENVESEINRIKQKYKLRGIIIDLADNLGGYFLEGLLMANLFIDTEKLSLYSEYNIDVLSYNLEKGDITNDLPITLIVDNNSASSSEIFAGLFKYFKRGKIVGKNTYGKGVGQSIINVNEDVQYALTTFEFYIGVEKIKINEVGIKPDIIIEEDYYSNYNKYITEAIKTIK